MEHFSQKDRKWKDEYIGHSTEKIGPSGCFLVSLSILDGRNPSVVNAILTAHDCIDNNGYMISECAASALGMSYGGKTTDPPSYPCVAETDFYKSKGYPQHFFVHLPNGEIYDPLLSYGPTVNNYPLVSYRLFKTNNESEGNMPWSDSEVKEVFAAVRHDLLGQNPTDNDLNADMGAAKERQKEPEDWALSEFVHDRFKEMKPKDCTAEVATAVACCTEKCDATKKEMEDEMTKELEEHNVFAKQVAAEMKKRDELIEKMINPADCPQVPDKNCNWWCKLWGCCK